MLNNNGLKLAVSQLTGVRFCVELETFDIVIMSLFLSVVLFTNHIASYISNGLNLQIS